MTATTRPLGRLHRLLAGAVAASLSLALTACGGGGGSAPADPAPPTTQGLATAQPGELLDYVRSRLAARGPQGYLPGTPGVSGDVPTWLDGTVTATSSGTVSRSGTLVQEAGVDEDDLIKTDGSRIYTLQPLPAGGAVAKGFAQLTVHVKGANDRPQPAGGAMLKADGEGDGWVYTRGLLLADGLPRVAVVGEGAGTALSWPDCPPDMACITTLLPYRPVAPTVHLQLLDVSQADKPGTPERLVFDGRLIGTRQIGRLLYVVASHAPTLAFDQLPATAPSAERAAALSRMTVAEVLPQISVNGGPRQPMLADTDCWLQKDNASRQVALTTLTVIDLGSPTWSRSTRCFAGGSEAVYMSTASLYVATSRSEVQTLQNRTTFAPETNTDVHKFGVDGARISYRGSGQVKGHLGWDRDRTPYRLSEHNGDLRVLSFTGSLGWMTVADASTIAPSPATLTVLRESAGTLRTVATLPNAQRPAPLGKPGEQVYGVRFAGDRGYVVTFRRIDPLYVLDLANPTDPRTAGVLEVPGFSDWLYPLDGGLLFGVGRDATAQGQVLGVKVALFDVRDASAPKLIDSRSFGQMGSSSALDYSPHGLALLAVGSRTRLALPTLLMDGRSAFPSVTMQRFEVDSATRTLAVKPPIELGASWMDLGSARTLLQGEWVHHLAEGQLRSWAW